MASHLESVCTARLVQNGEMLRRAILSAVSSLIAACATSPHYVKPLPGEDSAIVLAQRDDGSFACHSTYIRSIDGRPLSFSDFGAKQLSVPAGDRSMAVRAQSGWNNLFGCAYKCEATLSFHAQPEHTYQLYHEKEASPNRVRLTDIETNELTALSTCTMSGGKAQPLTSDETTPE
jgi:hypothetical protein